MKKSGIFKSPQVAKWLYTLLCVAVIGISIGTVAAYRQTAKSLTEDLVNDTVKLPLELDFSESSQNLPLQQGKPVSGGNLTLTQEELTAEEIQAQLQEVFFEKAVYMPISNAQIIGEFSFGELVKSPSGVWKTHDGIDIKADLGDPVKAMTSGTVTRVYNDPLWGNCMEIDHGDAITGYYCGLSEDIKYGEGDSVKAGDIIGFVGQTEIESAMEPHFHFALKYADKWIDPVGYIEPYK